MKERLISDENPPVHWPPVHWCSFLISHAKVRPNPRAATQNEISGHVATFYHHLTKKLDCQSEEALVPTMEIDPRVRKIKKSHGTASCGTDSALRLSRSRVRNDGRMFPVHGRKFHWPVPRETSHMRAQGVPDDMERFWWRCHVRAASVVW